MNNLLGKSPKILVIGDLMIDHYLWGTCERISPEAPVQIVKVDTESLVLGGAGNVIHNLKKLGAKVDFIGIIGDCDNSDELKKLLLNIDVSTKNLFTEKNRITTKKSRVISSHQQVIRYDRENTEEVNIESQEKILTSFKKMVSNYEVILLSDYGKGTLSTKLTQSLIKIANKLNKKILIDPKGSNYLKYKGAYLLTPNIKEASGATNINISDDKSVYDAIEKLKSEYELSVSIITLSERGVAIYDNDFRIHSTPAKEVFDVTGAGDTVLAALGFSLACELDIDDAVKFANLAAGVVIGKIGSATATLNEIIEYESSLNKSSSNKHIKSIEQITIISAELKSRGKKIIFTNGCFDVLHMGHVKYLEISKNYGDILIVGINSDLSVKKLKGPSRPINSQIDRAYILAALEVVDYVVVFDKDTPYELIKAIRPNTLIKGGDYKNKNVIGQDIVDELKIVDFIEGKSTTNTIKQIQKTN